MSVVIRQSGSIMSPATVTPVMNAQGRWAYVVSGAVQAPVKTRTSKTRYRFVLLFENYAGRDEGLTILELFTNSHKAAVSNFEKWASLCDGEADVCLVDMGAAL